MPSRRSDLGSPLLADGGSGALVAAPSDGGGAPAGEPDRRRRSTLLSVCPFILGNEFCERLAFYGMQTNLVVYLTSVMGESPASASIAVMIFEGTCYLTPVLGAYLADAAWGRYRTILTFSCIYFAGLVALALSTVIPGLAPDPRDPAAPPASRLQTVALFVPLYIVALGTGGIKPNVSAFGADQFDEGDPDDAADKKSFFNWFYLFVNVGSLIAVTCVVYVQDAVSWSVGFAIPAAAMGVAIAAFAAGAARYRHVAPTESPMARVVRVLLAARANAKAQAVARREGGGGGPAPAPSPARPFAGRTNLPPSLPAAAHPPLPRPVSYGWLSFAEEAHVPATGAAPAGGFAGFAPAQVEEVRLVVRTLPIFWTTAFYWAIYAQMGSFFVEQGAAMDRWTPTPWAGEGAGFTIPAASLALFNTVAIIALVPLYDRALTPLLERVGRKLTLLQRIGWGLAVCAAAMGAAALVERARLAAVAGGGVLPHSRHRVAALSVYWQVPQYLLVGASEVLTSIGQLEFFYDQAPDVMRSCSMALGLLSVAVGSYLSGAVVAAVGAGTAAAGWNDGAGWLPPSLNAGRLDLFFWLMAALAAANTVLFVWVASTYQYKDVPHGAASRAVGPPRPPATPPTPSSRPPPAAPVAVGAGRRTARWGRGGVPSPDAYGRSVTYVPPSPALPAPFR